jgi:hypothetical protein
MWGCERSCEDKKKTKKLSEFISLVCLFVSNRTCGDLKDPVRRRRRRR